MTADTYSNTLGYLVMGTGNDNNSWGTNANSSVFQIFEDAIANILSSTVSGGTLDLSGSPPPAAASQSRYAALVFSGTLSSNQVVRVPNLSKIWRVYNNCSGAFTLTLVTYASGVQGSGSLLTLGSVTGGSAYVNGTYTNVPLTGGSGNSAAATIVVSGNAVTSVTITKRGRFFLSTDTLSASNANLGGSGSGFSVAVGTVGNIIPNNGGWQTVLCDGAGNMAVDPFNSVQVQMQDGSASAPVYSNVNETNSGWYRNSPGNWRLSILGTDAIQVSASGLTITGNLVFSGALGFGDGTSTVPSISFNNEPNTGFYRSGTGSVGFVVLQSVAYQATSTGFAWTGSTFAGTDLTPTAALTTNQNNYNPPGLGLVMTLGSITGGSSYTNGTYTNVALTTTGVGTGIAGTVVVSGGAVTSVTITDRGLGSVAGDTLSALVTNIGGTGSGFSVPVATVDAMTGSCLRLNPTSLVKITGLAGGATGRELTVQNIGTATIQFPANSASSSAANRFASAFNLVPGQIAQLRYDITASLWLVKNVLTATSSCAIGAVTGDLLIVNDGSSPNSKRNITCGEAVLVDSLGNGIKFEGVSVSINYGGAGPGGTDGSAFSASTTYYEYLVSDGVTITGCVSRSSSAATMLAGLQAQTGGANYIYAKRVGACITNSSGNLYRVRQIGNHSQYVVGTNPAVLPNLANGTAGSGTLASPNLAAVSLTGKVPATASAVIVASTNTYAGNTITNVLVAPNSSWGGSNNGPTGSNGNVWPLYVSANVSGSGLIVGCGLLLESTSIYWFSGGAGGAISCLGWDDAI